MRLKAVLGLGLGFVALAGIVAGAAYLPSALQDKKVTLKVLLPQVEVKVAVDGKDYPDTGEKREIRLETKKDKITVVATWEPNGYTKIVRTRKVAVKDVIELDMSVPDAKMPDDITVIYVPTPDDVVDEMCKLGKVTKDDVVYDLGCGDGRMVIRAIKNFGAKKGVGVDIDEERVKESKENAVKAGVEKKVEFRKGDVLKIDDLPDASVVLLYMGEDINLRLRPILKSKLKPGSRVVSHRFTMGDWEPTRQLVYRGMAPNNFDYTLLLWVIGDKK
jgi:SAM-dependent methyltransferase